MVRCPKCGHEFSFAEIDSTTQQSNAYGIIPKPPGDKRKCPECSVETQYEMHNMFYREGFKEKSQSSMKKFFAS